MKTFSDLVFEQTNIKHINILAQFLDDMVSEEELYERYAKNEASQALVYALLAYNYAMIFLEDGDNFYRVDYQNMYVLLVDLKPQKQEQFDEILEVFFNHDSYNVDEKGFITKKWFGVSAKTTPFYQFKSNHYLHTIQIVPLIAMTR